MYLWRPFRAPRPSAYTDPRSVVSSSALQLNTWYKVEARKRGTTASLYVDGTLKATTTMPSDALRQTTRPLLLGACPAMLCAAAYPRSPAHDVFSVAASGSL